MNEQLKLLVKLQEIDSSILSTAEKIETLPRRLNKFRTPLKEAGDAYEKVKSRHEAMNKKKKDKDLQLDEMQDKIAKLKSRSSDIKTNKEYEAHLKEIESYEDKQRRIEDEILVLMEEIEAHAKELEQDEAKVKQAEEEFAKQEKSIEEEKKNLFSEIEKQKVQRKEYRSRIDEDNYNHYMDLLERSGGLAVVETKNEVCLGCHTNIPPQLYNDIKKNDRLYQCYYCKRFLYFNEPVSSENSSDTGSSDTNPASS